MPKGDKKQRHRAKRQAKKLAARRRESISPLHRLAHAPCDIECWMSENFEAHGQMQAFVFKRAAGLSGIACFLVDQGVVGLKDAWTRTRVERAEFDGMLEACARRGLPLHRVTLDDVRRLVAGGIRWASENGMRLPTDWVKCASMIGGVGDWASADLSPFVREFAGHPDDLRQRLIGEPFETYIRRTDISFIFSDSAPYMDQRTGEYIQEGLNDEADDEYDEDEIESIAAELPDEEINAIAQRLKPSVIALAAETADWLAASGQTPSPELIEAWQSLMLAALISKSGMPDAPEEDIADFGYELLQDLSARIESPRAAEYRHAVGQALEHLQTDPKKMEKAVLKYGLTDEPADSQDGQSG